MVSATRNLQTQKFLAKIIWNKSDIDINKYFKTNKKDVKNWLYF